MITRIFQNVFHRKNLQTFPFIFCGMRFKIVTEPRKRVLNDIDKRTDTELVYCDFLGMNGT